MSRLSVFVAAYGALIVAALGSAAAWLDHSPWQHAAPWLALGFGARHVYSLLLGCALGGLVVLMTRFAVERFPWARRLHTDLRPHIQGMGSGAILVLALMSAVGEELIFRGILQHWLGLVPQALLFGLVHQLPGPSRWVWATWAAMVGLALGAVFAATGSLLGPVAAHAVINGMNLHYLRGFDPSSPRPVLGGLFDAVDERRR